MAQLLGHVRDVSALRDEVTGVAVTEVVEPEVWEPSRQQHFAKRLGNTMWTRWLGGPCSENPLVDVVPAGHQRISFELKAKVTECCCKPRTQIDLSVLPGLR